MKNKYLALMICAVLTATMLSGCGKKEEVKTEEASQPEQVVVVEEPEPVATETEEVQANDLTGTYVNVYEEEMAGEIMEFTRVVTLFEDNTCEVTFQDTIPGTYTEDTIMLNDGSEMSFSVNGDELVLYMEDYEIVFDRTTEPPVAEASTEAAAVAEGPQFVLSTVDIDGNPVGMEAISGAKLVMVNFWEPWCGPCVHEMPDLEKIYEEYQSEGLMILGVFGTPDMDDDAREVLTSCGITYPILRYEDHMEPYITEYVPTTIFLDGNGIVLSDEPVIGGNDYNTWKQIIEEYMN